jgi:hypothetical protein
MVCSRRCIVVTIDGALYNVDVDVIVWYDLQLPVQSVHITN